MVGVTLGFGTVLLLIWRHWLARTGTAVPAPRLVPSDISGAYDFRNRTLEPARGNSGYPRLHPVYPCGEWA